MSNAYPTPQQGQAKSREQGGKNAPAGLWTHPETGNTVITLEDPLFGNAQSQAFLQAGFVFTRPAEAEEIHTLPQLALDRQKEERENLKGLSARLDKLEGVAEENLTLQERVKQLEAEKAASDAAHAQEISTLKSGSTTDEKPLAVQNDSEVRATAAREGVDLGEANTVKEKRALIQAARDAKQESEN